MLSLKKSKPASRRNLKVSRRSTKSDSLALLAAIVESSHDAIYCRKLDGTVTSWNRGAERVFGYKAGEIVGQSSEVLLPEDRREEMRRVLDRVHRGGRFKCFETTRLRRDGTAVTVLLSVSPLRDSRGRITGVSTVARDITAERKLEAELLRASERERQRLGRDLHDGLGQQLAGIELLSRTLARSLRKRGASETETAQILVAQIQAATQQTRALARGLTPVMDAPNGLMLALEDFAAATHSLFRIKCTFTCEEPVLIANHASAIHLFRIVQEAVTNAIRHGRARQVTIRLRRKVRALTLEIRDNGQGLRSQPTHSDGMGLHIMKYRASVLNGSFSVADCSPRGTLVTCSVPVAHLRLVLTSRENAKKGT